MNSKSLLFNKLEVSIWEGSIIAFKQDLQLLSVGVVILLLSYFLGATENFVSKDLDLNTPEKNCQKPTKDNPFMNYTVGDLINNKERSQACLYDMDGIKESMRKEFRNKNQMVESLEETIDILSFNQYDPLIEKHLYANKSWVQILDGLQLINPEICVKLLQNSDIDRIDMFRESLLTNYNNLEKICLTHKDFINYIKGHHET